MTLKAPNPWICMALSRKIALEIKYHFPAVGLHSANYHQEDKIIKKEARQIEWEASSVFHFPQR